MLSEWYVVNLSLLENPIEADPNFRVRVISIIPSLRVLNFKKVTQKVCGKVFNLPLGERWGDEVCWG